MKKALLLPLLLFPFAFCACSGTPSNMEEVKLFKALLAKQDLSPAYAKMFTSNFVQNYEVFSSTHGETDESETQFYSYRGGGSFGCFYEVDEASYLEAVEEEGHDFFDFLSRGIGNYGMVQTATLVSYHHDAERSAESLQSVDFLQHLETFFGENDLQIYNSLSSKTKIEGGYDSKQTFNGIIDKGTLFDAITPRALSDIFARTNLYDGQRSCEALDRIYFDLLSELSAKSDSELGGFLDENAIRIEEEGENLAVRFKVGNDAWLKEAFEENDIIPGAFEGTLTYEKESGSFASFDYRILYVANESDEETGDVHTASMEFKADGYSWNRKFDEALYIQPDPTPYDSAEAFINDVIEEVIPPSF